MAETTASLKNPASTEWTERFAPADDPGSGYIKNDEDQEERFRKGGGGWR